jgi:translation initiation factor eIF-2B subunit alpha
VVIEILEAALEKGTRFSVILTESRPFSQSNKTSLALIERGVQVTLIADSAVGYIMNDIDMVLVGAKSVVENGGIINTIGSYQISLVAKAMGKPVYVACLSFIFCRIYPLSQNEIPDTFTTDEKYTLETQSDQIQKLVPALDYTPPNYITLLFTDLGVLTPAAVSDELIKLYT